MRTILATFCARQLNVPIVCTQVGEPWHRNHRLARTLLISQFTLTRKCARQSALLDATSPSCLAALSSARLCFRNASAICCILLQMTGVCNSTTSCCSPRSQAVNTMCMCHSSKSTTTFSKLPPWRETYFKFITTTKTPRTRIGTPCKAVLPRIWPIMPCFWEHSSFMSSRRSYSQ